MKAEPTVLDYVKALLTPWRGAPPRIPGEEPEGDQGPSSDLYQGAIIYGAGEVNGLETLEAVPSEPAIEAGPGLGWAEARPEVEVESEASIPRVRLWPWRALAALALALLAQRAFEPSPNRSWEVGAGLYLIAAAWLALASWRQEWELPALPVVGVSHYDALTVRQAPLWVGAISAILAFLTFGGNEFNSLNLFFWSLSILLFLLAFWLPSSPQPAVPPSDLSKPAAPVHSWTSRLGRFIRRPHISMWFSGWSLVLIAAALLVLFFRLHRLSEVPPEMISDHAEKLLDIWDVLHGETHIFFPRNTGREGLQMYLSAAVIQLFGTGYSFLSLKIGTTIAGLLTLPFIYLIGKELGSRRAGLLAMVFAGIAYWPNVITRVALRFTLYPLFVAPALYFFLRGLRRSSRNDFILAGISLGIGLHGYTPIRILPFVLIVAVIIYWLHRQAAGQRQAALWGLGLTGLFAGLLFLPLARFWLEDPLAFGFRAFTRLGSLEHPLPEPALVIFFRNLWNALTMFTWSNGEIWPVSIPFRPALDVISGALFHAGVVLLAVRYLRNRCWVDLFLLLSIPLLLMPSILSLAFPSENPALNRGAGALVPVFLIVGLALDGLLQGFERLLGLVSGKRLGWGIAGILLLLAAFQNYNLVFRQYQRNYQLSSWNTSEIGNVIRAYTGSIGEEKNAYVVAYPHWVDTRLVGINAGFPRRDFAIWPESFAAVQAEPGPKLFVIYPQDTASAATLQAQYPRGYLKTYPSKLENKDFWLFFVLP